jgi:syntaxin-binding protein 1
VPPAGQLPERETCELILTDRGFDPVAPVIHEWTYEAMVFDMLGDTPALKDNVFTYDSETKGGERRGTLVGWRAG